MNSTVTMDDKIKQLKKIVRIQVNRGVVSDLEPQKKDNKPLFDKISKEDREVLNNKLMTLQSINTNQLIQKAKIDDDEDSKLALQNNIDNLKDFSVIKDAEPILKNISDNLQGIDYYKEAIPFLKKLKVTTSQLSTLQSIMNDTQKGLPPTVTQIKTINKVITKLEDIQDKIDINTVQMSDKANYTKFIKQLNQVVQFLHALPEYYLYYKQVDDAGNQTVVVQPTSLLKQQHPMIPATLAGVLASEPNQDDGDDDVFEDANEKFYESEPEKQNKSETDDIDLDDFNNDDILTLNLQNYNLTKTDINNIIKYKNGNRSNTSKKGFKYALTKIDAINLQNQNEHLNNITSYLLGLTEKTSSKKPSSKNSGIDTLALQSVKLKKTDTQPLKKNSNEEQQFNTKLIDKFKQIRKANNNDDDDFDDKNQDLGNGLIKKRKYGLKLLKDGSFGLLNFDMTQLKKYKLQAKKHGKIVAKGAISHDLYKLLTERFNPKYTYSDEAMEEYRHLCELAEINTSDIKCGQGKILKKQIKKTESKPVKTKFIYYDSGDELLERLHILLGTIQAGNHNHSLSEEASQLLTVLKDKGVVSKIQYESLLDQIL